MRPLMLLASTLVTPCLVAAEQLPLSPPTAQELHETVTDLKTRLEISAPVVVSIVPSNALMMSVESPAEHHPYLQTEELANQIAMRTVTRAALARLYEKVWTHGKTRGDLARVLGPEPTTAAALAPVSPQP